MKTIEIGNKTLNYYQKNYQNLIKKYNSVELNALNQLFVKYIKNGYKVLDIGFGSGRDLQYIKTLGAECYGIDSCQKFIDNLLKDSFFIDKIFYGKLPLLNIKFKFDVIILIAVIMHLTQDEIKIWLEDVKKYLSIGGTIIVSYSTTSREEDERFFEDLTNDILKKLFIESGFTLLEEICTVDGLNRKIEWRSEVYALY